jgi:nucleoside-diphosphate-sugar epimerase
MRVLVTGGGGFIGRRTVAMLVHAGHEVTVLDRSANGIELLEPEVRASVRWHLGETTSVAAVENAMTGQECVAHLAAGSSFLMYEERPIVESTAATAGFHTILDTAITYEVDRVVYLSTSAVYEGNPLPYREDMVVHSPDLKALAKQYNEAVAALYEERYGITTLALRPFSVYGPGETTKGPYANVISLFVWAMASRRSPVLWGDGSQTRDFVYVDDVARAVTLAVSSSATGVLNVGTGVETNFTSVIEEISRLVDGSFDPLRVEIPITIYASRLLASVDRSRDKLGFTSEVSLAEGIARVLASFLALPADERERLSTMHERFAMGVPARHRPRKFLAV